MLANLITPFSNLSIYYLHLCLFGGVLPGCLVWRLSWYRPRMSGNGGTGNLMIGRRPAYIPDWQLDLFAGGLARGETDTLAAFLANIEWDTDDDDLARSWATELARSPDVRAMVTAKRMEAARSIPEPTREGYLREVWSQYQAAKQANDRQAAHRMLSLYGKAGGLLDVVAPASGKAGDRPSDDEVRERVKAWAARNGLQLVGKTPGVG